MTPPRVAFKTVGCRLNRAETARMAAQFQAAGYQIVPYGEPCDVCVVHGCSVTQHAERTSVHFARHARHFPGKPFVVLAGCAAETARDSASGRTGADLLAGRNGKLSLPALIRSVRDAPAEAAQDATPEAPPLTPVFDTVRAWIKVQDGCDFHCAYCVVPITRGAPRSRPAAEILDEIRRVADAGYKEIVLCGANLGCYVDGSRGLVSLLDRIEAIPSVERVRLGSIEMTTAEGAVVDFMAASSKLCRFLHLPLQSGDDRVLKAMGRRYASDDYRRSAGYAVERVPLLGLGTDVLVGFPGEDDAAYEASIRIIEELPFSNLHVFPYSKRRNTPAASMPRQIPEAVKKERVRRLVEIRNRKRAGFARQFIGRPVSVLVEERADDGTATGWTGEYLEAAVLTSPGRRRIRDGSAVLRGEAVP